MSDNTLNNKKIAKNTVFLYLRMIFVLVVTLYTSRVLLRTLGVVDYGVYNVVAGFVSMFSFMNISLSSGIQRYYNFALGSKQENGVQKVYVTALQIQSLIAISAFLLVEIIGVWYLETKMVIPVERMVAARWVFQFSVLSMVAVMMQIPYSAAVMSYEKMNYYALVSVLDVVLKLSIVVVLPLIPVDDLQLYGILLFGVSILNFVLYFAYAKRHVIELKYTRMFDRDLFRSMLGFSGWNIVGTFAFMMKGQGLNMLLNLFFGPVVNAARGIAAQVLSGLQGFAANMLVAFRPQLIQSYAAGDYSRVRKIFFSESKLSYLLLCTITVPIIIEIEYVLNMWLGKDMVPDYTVSFTILVLLNMLVSAFHQPLTHIVHATGKQKAFQLTNAILVCSIVPVSWLFLKLGFDPNSVFIISLVLTILNIICCLFVVRSVFDFSLRTYLKSVIMPCIIFSLLLPIIPAVIYGLMDSSFVRFSVIVLSDILAAVFIMYYIILDKSEKSIVQSFIQKIVRK